jgi:hypothetical protein
MFLTEIHIFRNAYYNFLGLVIKSRCNIIMFLLLTHSIQDTHGIEIDPSRHHGMAQLGERFIVPPEEVVYVQRVNRT